MPLIFSLGQKAKELLWFRKTLNLLQIRQAKQKNSLFLEGEKQKVCFHLESESKLRDEKRSEIFRQRMKLCEKQVTTHQIIV